MRSTKASMRVGVSCTVIGGFARWGHNYSKHVEEFREIFSNSRPATLVSLIIVVDPSTHLLHRQAEPEFVSLSRLALHPKGSSHQLDELLRNGQTPSGFIAAGVG